MCFWFHPGWLFLIVPFVMLLGCLLLCVLMRRVCAGCGGTCCTPQPRKERQQ